MYFAVEKKKKNKKKIKQFQMMVLFYWIPVEN
jgi:hypothetical protein